MRRASAGSATAWGGSAALLGCSGLVHQRFLALEPAAKPRVRLRMWAMYLGMAAGVAHCAG
jgi:hypothetical protein